MISIRWVRIFLLYTVLVAGLCGSARAQSDVDTMVLVPQAPDSFYVRREGPDIIIGWYAPSDSTSKVIGSRDYTSWYGEHTAGDGVEISFSGYYTNGWIDRQIIVDKLDLNAYEVGVSPSIRLSITSSDMFDRTYEMIVDIGTDNYTPEDPIPMKLFQIGIDPGETPDVLEPGFNIHFSAGLIDTSQYGGGARFLLDVQDFEGFHVWRGTGEEWREIEDTTCYYDTISNDTLKNYKWHKVVDLSKYPSEQQVIAEISREDYFKYSTVSGIKDVPVKWKWLWEYFNDNVEEAWPRQDDQGRWYYEWVDKNVYAGETYHYNVTTFDRGYFRGFDTYNKLDNFICDEIKSLNEAPGDEGPGGDYVLCGGDYVQCDSMVISFGMTIDTGSDINQVYAVPNPYRSGTSEETTSYYHNYSDRTIKFFNMPKEARIKIYTVAGDLVWEGSHYNAEGSDGILSWDVKNMHGQEVASGIYVFRVESVNGEDVYGRIVVIR